MQMKSLVPTVILLLCSAACSSPDPKEFIRVPAGTIALTHVRVLDGTGIPARDNQTIVIEGGRIREIGETARVSLKDVVQTLDLEGETAMPGLVGMHDHLFYAEPPGSNYSEMLDTFPKLYLASGVTSLRTAGTLDIQAELKFKTRVEQGREIAPHLYLSTPYVEPNSTLPPDPKHWAQAIQQLVPLGITSVKVYTHARSSELAAVIEAGHRLGAQVTGHLCAVGFSEAASLGIDNLEHGLLVDTEFYSSRKPDTCPDQASFQQEIAEMEVGGQQIQALIQTLVQHHVAVTSTLPVFESFIGSRAGSLDARALPMLAPDLQAAYRSYLRKESEVPGDLWERLLQMEMEFERGFVKAGGLLVAGTDPTG